MQEEQQPADDFNADGLILKYIDNTLTDAERQRLEAWVGNSARRKELLRKLSDKQFVEGALQKMYETDEQEGWRKLNARMPEGAIIVRSHSRRRNYAVAASILVLILAASWFFYANRKAQQPAAIGEVPHLPERYKNDVSPGGNKAVLTLANGSQITLDDAANGILTEQGSAKVVKTTDGQLAYNTGHTPQATNSGALIYNTVSTPRGGQYEVVLPDGTHVWLNAASRLRFPASFSTAERIVDINGEGYFEVAHLTNGKGQRVPFKVNIISSAPGAAGGTQVEVLGTHFNIMAYDDERSVNTTLLEGAVKITNGPGRLILAPGQQAQVSQSGAISMKANADLESVMAWKNGRFDFKAEDIATIMRQMARWYNMDIVFEGKVPSDHFVADIPRNMPASKLLQVLELTGHVQFKIEGRKVTVTE